MSIDPDFELIDEVVVTPANAADHDPIDDLLAPVAEFNEKPVVFGDCAYGDGDTLAHLEGQGFEVRARVPPAVNGDGRYPTNRSCSNTRPIRNRAVAGGLHRHPTQGGTQDVRHEAPGCIPGRAGRNSKGGSWV